jgi:hypothetical protein
MITAFLAFLNLKGGMSEGGERERERGEGRGEKGRRERGRGGKRIRKSSGGRTSKKHGVLTFPRDELLRHHESQKNLSIAAFFFDFSICLSPINAWESQARER